MLRHVLVAETRVVWAVRAPATATLLLRAPALRALRLFFSACRRGLRWALVDARADTGDADHITVLVVCAAIRGPDIWTARQRRVLRRTLLFRAHPLSVSSVVEV